MGMTEYERLSLCNQYEILSRLALLQGDTNDSKYFDKCIKVLQSGYTKEYCELSPYLYEELTERDCDFVWDVLSLYEVIRNSYDKIEDAEISRDDIRFKGFDGNNEAALMDYCHFIVVDKDRFGYLFDVPRGALSSALNSHLPMIDKYERMLHTWQEMGKPVLLTEEQIKELINQ